MDSNTRALRTRETRLRRAAQRQGLTLTKSRRRDPRALDYGLYFLALDGSHEWRSRPAVDQGQGMTLDEVETYLRGDPAPATDEVDRRVYCYS